MDNRMRGVAGTPSASVANDAEQGVEGWAVNRQGLVGQAREIQVTGAAEVCCPADRATVRFMVGNSKASVSDVTSRVSKRVEYILQAARQHGVREEDVTVRKFLHRDEELYHMNSEVTVTFSDFEKMEQVCIILLEKLDKSVSVGMPRFFHSAECLNRIRQSVCVSAVDNAQQKASRVSQLLGQSLGAPTLIREMDTREWRGKDEDGAQWGEDTSHAAAALLPRIPTITATSLVSVYFRLREGSRKKL
ncbi:interleukin-1 receptor-associated kinase 1-binding protein 1 homolog [Dunckerocampus dactyliophorus]|uniref:interleukin-1 receptor-associated kinase 1-binding protein 1 homolog n=1 Tax=Dunckerocampus dactyliophorus TaxID=161453 RepID=UPI00240681EF|nr:interleukin-1 receptor-associated kinase 1-binding protein 1 homolog [Dunckerocampus dactyliophorus]